MAHTEAPASVTYSLTSPEGFGLLFTVRGEGGGALLEEMSVIEEGIKQKGYSPKGQAGGYKKSSSKSYGGKSYGGSDEATPKQMEVLKDWGLWKDGMTKSEASDVIGKRLGK